MTSYVYICIIQPEIGKITSIYNSNYVTNTDPPFLQRIVIYIMQLFKHRIRQNYLLLRGLLHELAPEITLAIPDAK